ncbi:hypothetical protein JCM8097_004243 [Rhodosporidiobolus ruineniae]
MSLRFSQSFLLDQGPSKSFYTNYDPLRVCIPGLSARFSLSRVDGRFVVSWTDARPVTISNGRLCLTNDTSTLVEAVLPAGGFPTSEEGSIVGELGAGWPRTAWPKTLIVRLELELEAGLCASAAKPEAAELAARSSGFLRDPPSTSIRLLFPRSGKTLWANESFLKQSSPYFEELLSSSFAEGTRCANDAQEKELDPYTFAESDEETDQLLPPAKEKDNSAALLPCKTIIVTDTAYSTYFAVLVYLQTGHIAFAPLSSSFRFSSSDPGSSRSSSISSVLSSSPTLPPPVSPKSTYRLAHLLSLSSLQSLALSNLVSQLTPINAAPEFYSDVATCYAEVRDKVLEYVVENWEEVKTSEGLKEVEEKAEKGELEAAANETGLVLARALADKYNKA